MLNFGTQITSNLMNMAEASRQEAARREELLQQEALAIRQEALEKDKISLAREQMFALREDQLLESEQKRQKITAEMQIEIERQRAAVETNRMMVNNEIMERREAEYILRKEREKQELLGLKENEKLEMKACYEQQIALERRLSEEKEKRLRSESQVCMLLQKRDLPPVPPHMMASRSVASAASAASSTQVFAKPAVPYKSLMRDVVPSPRLSPRPVTSHKLSVSNGIFVSTLPSNVHSKLHMAMPRMSCMLASATTPITTTPIQTLQPKIVADETKMATATAIVSSSDATVVSCSTNAADVVSVTDVSNVVLHANVMQSQNVVPQVPVPIQSTVSNENLHKIWVRPRPKFHFQWNPKLMILRAQATFRLLCLVPHQNCQWNSHKWYRFSRHPL